MQWYCYLVGSYWISRWISICSLHAPSQYTLFFIMPPFILFLFVILVTGHPNSAGADQKSFNGSLINVTKHLSFPYFSSSFINSPRFSPDVTLLGSAIISNEKGCIQIPDTAGQQQDDLRHRSGRAIYSSPVRLLDPITHTPASFQTTFSFQFQSSRNVSASSNDRTSSNSDVNRGGSGLTFIIAPDEFTLGRPGPWLGMLNDVCDEDYKTVAVEFDARQNPEFGDPNDNHVGINLGSIVSTTAINASDVGVYLKDGSIFRAWISYRGQKRYMDIYLGKDGEAFPPKPLFSGPLDLSAFLKEYMFVGFSASTGNHTQIHNIFSWNFTSTSQASLRGPSTETCESKITFIGSQNSTESAHSEPSSAFFIFLAVGILLLAVLLNLYFSRRRKDQKSEETIMLPEQKQRPRPPNKPRRFTMTEISSSTRCFSELQILGSDTRSVTYKATMLNGCNVAVKRLLTRFFDSHGVDRRRFRKEIKRISRIRHPNLVPVRGWCFDNNETIVVYDYIQNGSLDKWLFGAGVLPWTRRFKVIKDVAEALSYLHSKQLAHKNVKASSVFLDVSFRAVLGDFGYVLLSAESTRFESMVSRAADVFEFGVFILEVVAGRIRRSEPGEMDLLDMAWSMHERDEKDHLVDRRMGSVVNTDQAVRVLETGLLCTLNENKGRPTMEEVLEFLNLYKAIPELPPCRPVSLFPYSSTTGLCSGYACAPFK